MTLPVEVLAAEPTRAKLVASTDAWPRAVRFLSRPSKKPAGARLLVAALEELEQQNRSRDLIDLLKRVRRHHAGAPLVLLASGTGKSTTVSMALLQRLALLSKSSTPGTRIDPYIVPDDEAFRRLVLARLHGAEKQLIASATVEGGMLSVWSCEPRLFLCPVSDIPALAALDEETLGAFEVSETGTRIHWSEADLDINMDTVREHTDDEYRKKHEDEYRRQAAKYGKAIRALRQRHELTQKQIPGFVTE